MKTKMLVTLGASALVLGGIGAVTANASGRDDARLAAAGAARAGKALAHHQAPAAVAAAEAAVALAGQNADYRLLLGQSYLAAGRFVSARGAFADTLALAPANGKAALNLALMQIATGDWAGARATLDAHSAGIAPADRGLATALAGDPAGAVAMLTQVARSPDANAKVRQNLALSLALAGQWQAARAVAAVDLSPADLDARLEHWAAFARPDGAADQVASLLGVTPVADGGQPAALALAAPAPTVAVAAVAAPAPVAPVVAETPVAPQQVAETTPAAPPATDPAPGFAAAKVAFAPSHEVVQPLPAGVIVPRAALIAAGRGPMKIAVLAPVAPVAKPAAPTARLAKGNFVVQLGAFESAAVARDAWGRATHRLPTLAGHVASGMTFAARGASFYRLSVGGFARGDADVLCRRYRAAGGACFVRAGAGDQIAGWAKKPTQLASR